MGTAERIKEYLDFKGISKYKFCKDLGFSPKFLDNTSNIGTDKAGKILRYFPEINPDWLLTGQGSMLRGGIDSAAVKARIMQFADAYYVSRSQFFSELGISEQSFLDASTHVNSTILSTIAQMNNQLNRDWLMTGKGPMMQGETEELTHNAEKVIHSLGGEGGVPLYSTEAAAGVVTLFQDHGHHPIGEIKIPNMPKCDGAIYVVGDSMYPLLKSHDIILYKLVQDIKNYIFVWGEMYLLTWENDGDYSVVVKWVQRSEVGKNYVCLVSENRHHQPVDIPIEKIKSLAIVKASIRTNSMI